jgi:3-oxoacyl-[acyl-carrier-protein] synthase II
MSKKTGNNRRVVITGIGPVSSNGIGKTDFWNGLLSGKVPAEKLPERFTRHHDYQTSHYVPFPNIDLKNFGFIRKYARMLEGTALLSLIGAELAFLDAGLKKPGEDKIDSSLFRRSGIVLGNGISSLSTGFSYYTFHTYKKLLSDIPKEYPQPKFNRMAIPSTMPDSASSWISILYGINSSNYTLNASCASGTYALGEAWRKIKDGYADLMISGGVEALNDSSGAILRGFDSLGTLTNSADGRPMPFSNKRSGFLFAEGGSCILILEELEAAMKRGAQVYAEIVDYQSNSDAHNIVQVQESGEQISRLLESIVADHRIDYLNTHGTGTELNDKVEQKVINKLFGGKKEQPTINSTKSIVGHTIGASGAFELAASAISIKESKVHANIAIDMFDDLNIVEENSTLQIKYALKTSYGFGGHNAAMLLKRFEI